MHIAEWSGSSNSVFIQTNFMLHFLQFKDQFEVYFCLWMWYSDPSLLRGLAVLQIFNKY